jgi:hypothetical protein
MWRREAGWEAPRERSEAALLLVGALPLLPLLLVCWRCCGLAEVSLLSLLRLLWAAAVVFLMLKTHCPHFDPHVSASVHMCPQVSAFFADSPQCVRTVSACVRIVSAIFFTILSWKGNI